VTRGRYRPNPDVHRFGSQWQETESSGRIAHLHRMVASCQQPAPDRIIDNNRSENAYVQVPSRIQTLLGEVGPDTVRTREKAGQPDAGGVRRNRGGWIGRRPARESFGETDRRQGGGSASGTRNRGRRSECQRERDRPAYQGGGRGFSWVLRQAHFRI